MDAFWVRCPAAGLFCVTANNLCKSVVSLDSAAFRNTSVVNQKRRTTSRLSFFLSMHLSWGAFALPPVNSKRK